MTPVQDMTDAEIVAAVRSGACALVPVASPSGAIVGRIDRDDLKSVADRTGLLIQLTEDQCRFVAPQVIR